MKKFYTILIVVALMFSLVACGKKDEKTEESKAPEQSATSEATTESPKETESSKVEETKKSEQSALVTDKTVRIGISGTPDLDPAVANSNSSNMAMANVYDALVFPSKDGVEPRLAESWEVSDDGLSYTFVLRQGVPFHTGGEVKASDVKYSMDRFLTIGEGYAYIFADTVDSVEVLDDYTVKFNLKAPFGPFVDSLVRFFILSEDEVSKHYKEGPYGEYGDYGKSWLVTNDAGTGAYVAKEIVQQDYFHAVKFDDWFLGWEERQDAPDSFRLLDVREPATVRTMMSNKEMEMTDQWQSAENLKAISAFDGVSIANYSTLLMYNLYMNTQKAPLDDLNFRKGLACLVDYESIVENIFLDSVLATSPISAGVRGHVDTNVMEYNIEKAKEYFAESKYSDELDGTTIEMLVNSDVADLEKVALLLQATCAEVGINLKISKAPWVSIVDRVADVESTPHLLAINSAPAYNDAGVYLETRYSSKTMGTWENCEWLASEALDTMISEAMSLTEDDARLKEYEIIQNHIVDELYPTIFLCDLTERLAYQSSYLSWPLVEEYKGDGVASSLYGFSHIISDMKVYPDKK